MAEINISNLGGGGGGTLSLTTTGTGGASTYVAGVLNIPVYQSQLTNPVTGTGTATRVAFWGSASSVSSSANLYWDDSNSRLGVGTATPGARLQVNGTGLLTATAFAVKDSGGTDSFTVADNGNASVRGVLTISGSSASNSATLMGRTSTGEVTSVTLGTNLSFSGNTLNATSGGITSLNGLTAASQSLVTGTTGTDFNISSATSTHTFNLPTASATNRGALSSADWTTFNNKQNAITNPVTGTGTATRVAFWDTASSVSSSANLYWDDSNSFLGVGTATPGARLQVNGSGLLTATAFAVKDSGGTDSFTVRDNGNTSVRGVLTITGSSASNSATLMGRTSTGEVASVTLGTNLSFSGNTLNATGGGGTPAGVTGQVQFNNAGVFGASSNLNWDITNSRLGIGEAAASVPLSVFGRIRTTGVEDRTNSGAYVSFSGGQITIYGSAFNTRFGPNGTVIAGTDFFATSGVNCEIRGRSAAGGATALLVSNTTVSNLLRIENNGKFTYWATNTAAGTTGAQTIDRPSGTVNFAAGATSLVVTNALCTTSSIVLPVIRTNDATATIKNVVPGAGSFTINLNAAATAETSVGFWIIN